MPVYQRKYEWREEECGKLFDDLERLHGSGRKSHFFGSLLLVDNCETREVCVVDGQQRLTTVSLLLLALARAHEAGDKAFGDEQTREKVWEEYLIYKFGIGGRRVRLKPIKGDAGPYLALLEKPKDQWVKESNITKRYEFLYDAIKNSEMTADEILKAVEKLEVMRIMLDNSDDPQLVFESVNARGLELRGADKIKNYLFMSIKTERQEDLYSQYWMPIDGLSGNDVQTFIYNYLTAKLGRSPKRDEVYEEFRRYVDDRTGIEGSSAEVKGNVLKDMYGWAKLYDKIRRADTGSVKVDRKFRELVGLELSVVYPFLMAFLEYVEREEMSEAERCDVLNVVENYIARRIVCGCPSNALKGIFRSLHRDVVEEEERGDRCGGEKRTYVEALVNVLLQKKGGSRFPDDEEIRKGFAELDVYKLPKGQRWFFFERLENRGGKEVHDVVKMLEDKDASIEHIMPQTLSSVWEKELGVDWKRVHRQYLNTMANLTLTGYNSEYGNKSFREKRDEKNGYKESIFRLNKYVAKCEKWTEKEMIGRQKELLGAFFELWPMPKGKSKPEPEAEIVSLGGGGCDLTGRKLVAYWYHGERYPVKDWRRMLEDVCAELFREKRAVMEKLCKDGRYGLSDEEKEGRYARISGTAMYVFFWSSTVVKIRMLRGWFDECGIERSELAFELRKGEAKEGRSENKSTEKSLFGEENGAQENWWEVNLRGEG